jgi:hypothetical protein
MMVMRDAWWLVHLLLAALTIADRVAPQHCKEESLRLLIKKVNQFQDDLPSVGGTLLAMLLAPALWCSLSLLHP